MKLQLSAADLFKYGWPFCGHQALGVDKFLYLFINWICTKYVSMISKLTRLKSNSIQYHIQSKLSRGAPCAKSVKTRSFLWSMFSCIQCKYREVKTRKTSVFGHFSRSGSFCFRSSSVKKAFLKIFQNSHENTCVRNYF